MPYKAWSDFHIIKPPKCPFEVHEDDLVANYHILKEYLMAFAASKLPSAEDQKVFCLDIHIVQKR